MGPAHRAGAPYGGNYKKQSTAPYFDFPVFDFTVKVISEVKSNMYQKHNTPKKKRENGNLTKREKMAE